MTGTGPDPPAEAFRQVVAVAPGSVRAVRQALLTWLGSIGWPNDGAEDLVLAVSEAATNCAKHAYLDDDGTVRGGPITVAADVDDRARRRRVVVTVSDRGRWRGAHPDRRRPPGYEVRRHGLYLIRMLTEELDITSDPAGTVVRMASRPIPVC